MSTAEILSLISVLSFLMSAIFFLLSVFFWFKFKIPTVIGDLSGSTARKSIAKMRESNEKSGSKSYRTSSVNLKRGKLTDVMPDSGKQGKEKKKKSVSEEARLETGLLKENMAESFHVQQTALLDEGEQTGLLVDENVSLEGTKQPKRSGGKKLVMLDEVLMIHTDEVIED